MRDKGLAAVLILSAVLGGCNTPESLMPPAEVGEASGGAPQQSVAAIETDPSGNRQSYPAASTEQSYVSPPQNTLEAQARALESGAAQSPARSSPLSAPRGQDDGGALAQPMPQQPQVRQTEPTQVAAAPATARDTVRFLPIIGAPVQAVTPLSRQLGAEARANGLTIKGANDAAGSSHILKGYFSAFADGGKVTVVYVWDILDASGARLHRLQGQDTVPAAGAEPWAAVPPSLMQQIATKTISDYLGWKRTQPG